MSQTGEERTMELTTSLTLNDAIRALWQDGGEHRLTDLVDAPFDEVVVLRDGSPAAAVNRLAGTEVVLGT